MSMPEDLDKLERRVSVPTPPPVHFETLAPGIFAADLIDPEDCDNIVSEFSHDTRWVDAGITTYRGEVGMRVENVISSRRVAQHIRFRDLDLSMHPLLVSFLNNVRRHVLPLIATEFGLNVREMGEAEIVRYPLGGMFAPHSDASVVKPYRAFSVLLYLNDEFRGGGTDFPILGFTCEPRKGRVLVFPSLTTHAGNPVAAGSKQIIVMWIFCPGSIDEYPV